MLLKLDAEKSLKDLDAELSAEEKSGIETAIADLKEALKGSDQALIEDKLNVLTEVSSKMAERIYAKQGESAQAAEQPETEKKADESVLDAEFEEVKDDKK